MFCSYSDLLRLERFEDENLRFQSGISEFWVWRKVSSGKQQRSVAAVEPVQVICW